MSNFSEFIGYVAAVLTTTSFVPQAWHTFRTRDVSGISLGMYGCFTVGVALWLAYGVLLDAPLVALVVGLVLANAVTLTLAGLILSMKLRYARGQSD